jgi:predicted RNA-binding Zn ribbon-like protein
MELDSYVEKTKMIGGRLCLDFTNTVGGRESREAGPLVRHADYAIRSDKLKSYSDLVAWSRHADILTEKEARGLLRLAGNNSSAAKAVFKRGVRLREALYRIFKSIVEGWNPDAEDVDALNRELARAREHELLARTAEGFSWEWDEKGKALDSMIWEVIRSASGLLVSGEVSRVRQCGGENCGWLFLDTSRNRSRQWCDMRDCGNLAKVRRFRERQQERS